MVIKIRKKDSWIDTGIKLDKELNKSNQAVDVASEPIPIYKKE